jgi:SufS family cysteine desulfurase
MSTPRPEAIGPIVSEEAFDTALLSRLVNELFAGRELPAGLPGAVPTAPALAPPHAIAGVPGAMPSSPSIDAGAPAKFAAPAPSSEPALSPDLAGGFSSAGPAGPPPVHPTLLPAKPAPAPVEPATASGGHDVKSADVYAFGEPRFCGAILAHASEPAGHPASTHYASPLPGIEAEAEPQYYFLPRAGVSEKTSDRPSRASALTVFNVETVRRDFPALHQRVHGHPLIWLDNAATTQKPQSVIDATSRFYSRDNSNIHRAAHALSERSTALFEAGREKVRQFLGAADAKEIVFLRGTTEAINLVAQSYGKKHIGSGDEIILTELEHHANIVPWQLLAEQTGAVIRVVPIDDRGELILEEFVKLLGPRTKFVSVAHVSNSLGTVNPVEQIIQLAHARGVPVLVDGAQSTPHMPVNVTVLDADFYVFSAHKIFGPTGVGALYGKSHLLESMPPYQGGGHMIEDVRFEKTIYRHAPEKFEAGTPDIVGVVGLGAAIDYLTTAGIPAIAAYEHDLLEYATQALATVRGIRPIGTAPNKASVFAFVIPGVSNENIARHLDHHGIAVRAGHHCALPAVRHFGLETTVRPSLAFYNTRDEVDTFVKVLHRLPRK